jgi:prophage endopeptidase
VLPIIDPRAWAIIGLAIALAAALGLVGVQTVRLAKAEAAHAATKAKNAETLTNIANLATDAAKKTTLALHEANRANATIDTMTTKEKEREIRENNRRRGRVTSGAERLFIDAKCPSPASSDGLPPVPSAPGVDDGNKAQLTAEAGSAVLDVREAIIEEQAALIGLQRYVREVCQAPPP